MPRKKTLCGKVGNKKRKDERRKARAVAREQQAGEASNVLHESNLRLDDATDICISCPGTFFAVQAFPLCLFNAVHVAVVR